MNPQLHEDDDDDGGGSDDLMDDDVCVTEQIGVEGVSTRTSELTLSFEGEVYVFPAVTPHRVPFFTSPFCFGISIRRSLASYTLHLEQVLFNGH